MRMTFISTAGRFTLEFDLQRAKTVILTRDDQPKRYELWLDPTTAARLRHTGYRPSLRLHRDLGPIVSFTNVDQPREWFEWQCRSGSALWIAVDREGNRTWTQP